MQTQSTCQAQRVVSPRPNRAAGEAAPSRRCEPMKPALRQLQPPCAVHDLCLASTTRGHLTGAGTNKSGTLASAHRHTRCKAVAKWSRANHPTCCVRTALRRLSPRRRQRMSAGHQRAHQRMDCRCSSVRSRVFSLCLHRCSSPRQIPALRHAPCRPAPNQGACDATGKCSGRWSCWHGAGELSSHAWSVIAHRVADASAKDWQPMSPQIMTCQATT